MKVSGVVFSMIMIADIFVSVSVIVALHPADFSVYSLAQS